jgi:hypothetical protein
MSVQTSGFFEGAPRTNEEIAAGIIPSVRIGQATLVAGTVVVADPLITLASKIKVYAGGAIGGGATGALFIAAKSAGVSFTITSTAGTDVSVVQFEVVSY